MVHYSKLKLPFNLEAMKNELSSFQEEWINHFNTYYYEGEWTVMPLRSPGGDSKNIIPELLMNKDYQDTLFMTHFVSVKELLLSINCPVMAVRFLNLKAGAKIKEHKDNELAFEKGEARLHFPVITNNEVEFYIEKERILLNEGECWYINANLLHSVFNKGAADRIHLVIDCKVNDWLSDMITQSDNMLFKEHNEYDQLVKVIENLRLQNSSGANKVAMELEQKLKRIK
ncbi:MAG: hypothetical protein JWP44_3005 [Mucilaginibacter sp.]|nr:hypothetical protein [Mucilaginibacter sp.]